MLSQDKIKSIVTTRLTASVDNIFTDMQSELNITSGDISPLDSLGLDNKINDLAKTMSTILDKQPRETNTDCEVKKI
ncbi:MAG: hypothetical protein K6F00_11195 [Lachnospiraceae bacterium]|nr:hypothetical protein [Lachnospiraceae bacterium]